MSTPGESPLRTWIGPALMLCGSIAIGFAPIGLRLSDFGPQATAVWRFLFSLPLLAGLAMISRGGLGRPDRYSILAGFFFGLDIVFWHASLKETSVANATFLVNLGGAAAGLIAWLALGQKPGRYWFGAMALALTGAWLLSHAGEASGQAALTGDFLALAAASMLAVYLICAMLARRTQNPFSVLFWSTLVSIGVAGAAAIGTHETLLPASPHWLFWPLMLALVAHVGGQGLIVAGVGRTAPSLAGLMLLIQPVAAAIVAWRLFDEALTPMGLAGAMLILFGVWLAGRR
jgi:drug/metabolite transporter (DMT)-like permease